MTTTTASQTEMPMIPWWLVLIQGIAALILGFLLLINPASTTLILVQFLGIYWFVSGIFSIISIFLDRSMWGWKLFVGILGIIAGVIIIQAPLWSAILVPTTLVFILGIEGLIIGVVQIIQAFRGGGWGIGLLGVLAVIFGILLIIHPFAAALALPFVFGIFGIIGGIVAIVMAFKLK